MLGNPNTNKEETLVKYGSIFYRGLLLIMKPTINYNYCLKLSKSHCNWKNCNTQKGHSNSSAIRCCNYGIVNSWRDCYSFTKPESILTLCWACGCVRWHHAGMFSSHLENGNKMYIKELHNYLQRLAWIILNNWEWLWVGAEHSKSISGDQVVHTTTFNFGGWYQWRLYSLLVSPS